MSKHDCSTVNYDSFTRLLRSAVIESSDRTIREGNSAANAAISILNALHVRRFMSEVLHTSKLFRNDVLSPSIPLFLLSVHSLMMIARNYGIFLRFSLI